MPDEPRAVESAFWFGEHLKCDLPCQEWEKEIEQRDAAIDARADARARADERQRVIEECARVAERCPEGRKGCSHPNWRAKAIRALAPDPQVARAGEED